MIRKKKLLQMLSDTESYNIERTASTSNMDKFCQAICAFSNDISGSGKNGYLIIGAKDNGEFSGLQVDDKLLLQIANIRTDGNILPQPTMTVEKFSFDEGDVFWSQKFSPQNFLLYVIAVVCGCVSVLGRALQQRQKKRYLPKGGSPAFIPLMLCLVWKQALTTWI